MGRLEVQPIRCAEAKEYVRQHHRHNPSTGRGWLFGCGLNDGEKVVGVIMVSRPVARHFDDGYTAEVSRCCTDGTPNASSMLYGAAWRAAKALGYRRIITYTRADEGGASLRGAGWTVIAERRARSWDKSSTKERPRVDKTEPFQRTLWEMSL